MRQSKQPNNEYAFSILTLDDDPIMTSTVQAYFQRSGYRVDVENDPNRAIERIRAGHYDILLLDFLMTPICGDQVVAQVRQFNQDIFIILLTGHKSMAPPIKTIRALDIQGYYEKSDRFDQLELLVESCAKSIRQMRTIRSYKDGLATIMDSLPRIYDLQSVDSMADGILRTVMSLLPCTSVMITLDIGSPSDPDDEDDLEPHFISRAVGEAFTARNPEQVRELLHTLEGQTSLVQENSLLLPLLDNAAKPVGLLSLELKLPPKYDQIQLMEVLARQASSALCNAHLHSLVQTKNIQLDRAYSKLKAGYLEMISAIRRIVDAKDIYTRGHSDRVSRYAVLIARKLGRDRRYCEQIRIAGLFHDVGKLSIPDEILLKDTRLTAEEYEVIKTHSRNGADILGHITQFHPILPAVLSHHERYDGTGYPDGLQGEEIPEMARIIAAADAFDAMTSNRQYRASLAFQQAVEELEHGKGSQFDPLVVETFLQVIQEEDSEHHPLGDLQDSTPFSIGPASAES